MTLPPFNYTDPELWFSQVELGFASAGISSNIKKFEIVAQSLESRVASEVRDLVVAAPSNDSYTSLKTELIKRLSASQEEKTRRFLENEELGDRKPSQFLRHLKSLAGSTVPDNIIRAIWFNRLPNNIQPILAAQNNSSLEDVADLADKVMNLSVGKPTIAAAATPSASAPSSIAAMLAEQIQQMRIEMSAALQQEIANFRAEISELRTNQLQAGNPPRARERSYSRGRSSLRGRSKSRGRYAGEGICWYHEQYGASARKCTRPCKFAGSENYAASR
ncbi:uncharacterized protein LOC112904235 [Agrilus planipennis]|nr:uncharacterized protein LOC112904235 [Agrilus planipennis]